VTTGDSPADRFVWTSPDGVSITLPAVRRVKSGTLRKLRNSSELDLMYGVLEDMLPPDELAKTDELDMEQLEALFAAWQSSGVSLGEPSRSST